MFPVHSGIVSSSGTALLKVVQRLMRAGVVPEEASGAVVGELFKTGKAATAISGPWFASDVGPSLKYRVVPLPKVEAAGAPMRPFLTVEAASLTPRAMAKTRALSRRVARPAPSAQLRHVLFAARVAASRSFALRTLALRTASRSSTAT